MKKNEKSMKKVLMHSDLVRMAMLFPSCSDQEEITKKIDEPRKPEGEAVPIEVIFIKKRD